MSVLILDNFTDTNGTALESHTIAPTNTPAATWSVLIGAAGQLTISSNRVVSSGAAGNYTDVCDSGASDCTIKATVQCVGATAEAGIAFRVQDASNFWYATGYAGDGHSYLYKVSAGSTTNPTSSAGSMGVTSGVDFTLEVDLSGSSITVKVNGTTAYTFTDSSFSTATKHGLRSNSSSANQWDAFEVDSAAAAAAQVWPYLDTELCGGFSGLGMGSI